MTMDSMEMINSQTHSAATSPFLLSSSPLGHHTTFNLQTVQLSFDTCLTYNSSTICSTNSNSECIGNANFISGISPDSSISAVVSTHDEMSTSALTSLSSKSTSTLNLTTLPESQQCISVELLEQHDHNKSLKLDTKKQINLENSSLLENSNLNIKRRRLHQSTCENISKECSEEYKDNSHTVDDKDKPGDLNTPVTTSGDLPSFFGPAVLVEPPPISGIDNFLLLLALF